LTTALPPLSRAGGLRGADLVAAGPAAVRLAAAGLVAAAGLRRDGLVAADLAAVRLAAAGLVAATGLRRAGRVVAGLAALGVGRARFAGPRGVAATRGFGDVRARAIVSDATTPCTRASWGTRGGRTTTL